MEQVINKVETGHVSPLKQGVLRAQFTKTIRNVG